MMKKTIIALISLCVLGLAFYFVSSWYENRLYRDSRFASGNGRIEATEINIAARLPGKVELVKVLEGDMVKPGQVLVVMQTNVLVANLAQAEAKKEQAVASLESANAQIQIQNASLIRAKAEYNRCLVIEKNENINYKRYAQLIKKQATSQQQYENAEMVWRSSKAKLDAAHAEIKEVEANLCKVKADAIGAKANIHAAEAEINSIKADIDDSILKAPLWGRIQYRIAEPGEVLSAGGRALNMIDLTDVYITFFLPEETAGKVRIGSDVRIRLDAVPDYPLPAKVTYVASTAQFTPKTVETRIERQKLMFRVKAHIDRALLEKYINLIKTGLPGVAWVKLDPTAEWPKELQVSEKVLKRVEEVRTKLIKSGVLTPGSVLNSQTGTMIRYPVLNEREIKKEIKGKTKEELIDLEVKTTKKVNESKNASTESSVKSAKQVSTAKKDTINKIVDEVKVKTNKANKTVIISGEKK